MRAPTTLTHPPLPSLLQQPPPPPPSLSAAQDGNQYIDESGPLRYYGNTSGYYMLKGSKNFKEGVFRFNSKSYRDDPVFSSTTIIGVDRQIDLFAMPPPDLVHHLLDLYFSHFYPLLPLIHKKSFLASLESSDNPPSPLLLNAIFAVAARISPDPRVRTDPSLPDTAGDLFFERAKGLLEFEWDNFRVSTVQSLLLLSSHQNGAMKTIRGWLYSGLVSGREGTCFW